MCQSSSRFTNNNNYFCIVKLRGSPGHFSALDELVTPYEKSTNWNGGSISISCVYVVGVEASENCEEYKRKTFVS